MKAYSPDLRERIVGLVESGKSKAETARLLCVSLNTVKRMVKLKTTTGGLATLPKSGRKVKLSQEEKEALLRQIELNPDATLAWHCQHWVQNHPTSVSPATLCRLIATAGLTRKKKSNSDRTG